MVYWNMTPPLNTAHSHSSLAPSQWPDSTQTCPDFFVKLG